MAKYISVDDFTTVFYEDAAICWFDYRRASGACKYKPNEFPSQVFIRE